MHLLDWIFVLAYIVWVVDDGLRRARGTDRMDGYFVANRSLPYELPASRVFREIRVVAHDGRYKVLRCTDPHVEQGRLRAQSVTRRMPPIGTGRRNTRAMSRQTTGNTAS